MWRVVGGFASGNYWSSSQYFATSAWLQYLGNGGAGYGNKNYALRVRPVRAF